jgi:hypothetical protein
VVLIHVEITVAFQIEVECAMPCKQLKHVIEESDSGRYFVLSFAFDGQLKRNARFSRVAYNRRCT